MAEITPTIVFEDIVWGEGFVEIPTFGGGVKQGTKLNLGNMPFDATRTVAQAMQEMINLLNSQKYDDIHNNLSALLVLRDNLQKYVDLRQQLDKVVAVSSELDTLRNISTRLPMLDNVPQLIDSINKYRDDMNYALCQVKRDKEFIRKDIDSANRLVYGTLEPLVQAVTQARFQLDTIIATAREDVIAGQEIVVKFATYSLEIQPKRYCFNPRLIIDDDNQKIIWQVPVVKGDCSVMTEIPTQLVQDAVDAYINTLHIGGGETYKEKRMNNLPSMIMVYTDVDEFTIDVSKTAPTTDTNTILSDLNGQYFIVHTLYDAHGEVVIKPRFATDDTNTQNHKLVYFDENGNKQYVTGYNSGAFKKGETLLLELQLGDDDLGGTNSFYIVDRWGGDIDEPITQARVDEAFGM